jgi:hypothetical protein
MVKFSVPDKLFIFLLLFAHSANAQVVSSIQNGFWSSPSTWSSNTVPQPSDTILIDSYVQFADTIYISPNAGQLTIDSCGTLCGDACFNGSFNNYGKMYIGCFILNAPSYNYDTIISNNTGGSGLTAGGYLRSFGYVSIGPNMPPCVLPSNKRDGVGTCQRIISAISEIEQATAYTIYPNPASTAIFISNKKPLAAPITIVIYDISGRCLQTISQTITGTLAIPVQEFLPGYYLVKITDENLNTTTGKFSIVR